MTFRLGGLLLPLGNVQASLGRHQESFASHEAALGMFYAANGNNYDTAQSRLKLAEHLSQTGRFQEAWSVLPTPSFLCLANVRQ
jgi:Tetratricopeptide repeat